MVGVTEDRVEAHCSCSPTSPSFGPFPLLVVVGKSGYRRSHTDCRKWLYHVNCVNCCTRPRWGDNISDPWKMALTSDYKHSKEAFVSDTTGSTVFHVNLISLVALVCPLLSPPNVHTDTGERPPSRYTLPSAHDFPHAIPFSFFPNGYSSSFHFFSR